MRAFKNNQSGITLIETLVVIGLATTILTAVIVGVMYAQQLITDSQARLSAMTLMTERIEYFRSLPYHDVGTVGGPVFGSIPNNNIINFNGMTFYEDVRVDFVFDWRDDDGGDDIITDYKKVEVEIEWNVNGATSSVAYTTNIVPLTVETAEGYGAIQVAVIDDATGLPLEGAEVRITNNTTTTTIDFTRTTGASGVVLAGVPAHDGYHASTTKANYSFDKTYESTPSNPTSTPGSILVQEGLISDRPFRIGELSDIDLNVYSDISDVEVLEDFDDLSGVSTSSVNVEIDPTSRLIELTGSPGSYSMTGTATLKVISPASIINWEKVVVVGVDHSGADYYTRFFDGDCDISCTVIDEVDLPGNSTGFTDNIIDISNLSASTYPDLTIQIQLIGDGTLTPSVDDVAVYYRSTETPRTGANISLHGDKVIGVDPDIYKIEGSYTTNGSGLIDIDDIEFDEYTLNTGTLTPTRVCGNVDINNEILDVKFDHRPGLNSAIELVLENVPPHTHRTIVVTGSGDYLPGAEVLLERPGFSETRLTDSCGQAFHDVTDGDFDDYQITVTRAGYDGQVFTNQSINGDTRLRVVIDET